VKLFHGDSSEVLAREVPGLGRPTTFWLDAHDDSDAHRPTPVCAEVEAILRALGGIGEHVILIDDVRMFGLPGRWGEHMTVLELMKTAQGIDESVVFRLEPNSIQSCDVLVMQTG
jgi:hypothetical protein